MDLYLNITFNVKEDRFGIESNIKKEKQSDILAEVVLSHTGAGTDDSPREERDVYKIGIQVDLSDDSFKITSNTGNKGLTTGIIMHVLSQM